MALADDSSPAFVPRGMNAFASLFMDVDKIKGAYEGDGSLSWGDHHPCLFSGTEWFFRTGYRASLASEWIPALDGVDDKLRKGAKVADVGCGHGASVVVMAEAYPKSKFWGFDFHAPSIETSKARASEAGVSKQTTLQGLVREGLRRPVRPHLLLRLPARHGRPGRNRAARARASRRRTAPSFSSSRSRSRTGYRTSARIQWPRCSTRHRRRSAPPTHSHKKSASASEPKPGPASCGRS